MYLGLRSILSLLVLITKVAGNSNLNSTIFPNATATPYFNTSTAMTPVNSTQNGAGNSSQNNTISPNATATPYFNTTNMATTTLGATQTVAGNSSQNSTISPNATATPYSNTISKATITVNSSQNVAGNSSQNSTISPNATATPYSNTISTATTTVNSTQNAANSSPNMTTVSPIFTVIQNVGSTSIATSGGSNTTSGDPENSTTTIAGTSFSTTAGNEITPTISIGSTTVTNVSTTDTTSITTSAAGTTATSVSADGTTFTTASAAGITSTTTSPVGQTQPASTPSTTAISSAVRPTQNTRLITLVEAKTKLEIAWNESLLNKSSQEYKDLEKKFRDSVKKVYESQNVDADVTVNGFMKEGSVIVDYVVIVTGIMPNNTNPQTFLISIIKTGKLGNFSVVSSYIKVNAVYPGANNTTSTVSTPQIPVVSTPSLPSNVSTPAANMSSVARSSPGTISTTTTTSMPTPSPGVPYNNYSTYLNVSFIIAGQSCVNKESIKTWIEKIYNADQGYDFKEVTFPLFDPVGENCSVKIAVRFGQNLMKKSLIKMFENEIGKNSSMFGGRIIEVKVDVHVPGVTLKFEVRGNDCQDKCCGTGGPITLYRSCAPSYKCVNYKNVTKDEPDCTKECSEECSGVSTNTIAVMVLLLSVFLNWFLK